MVIVRAIRGANTSEKPSSVDTPCDRPSDQRPSGASRACLTYNLARLLLDIEKHLTRQALAMKCSFACPKETEDSLTGETEATKTVIRPGGHDPCRGSVKPGADPLPTIRQVNGPFIAVKSTRGP